MRTIRAKLFVLVLVTVFLPLIPAALLVDQLIYDSYRVGVNEDVSKALQNGVDYSREIYQSHKEDLQTTVTLLSRSIASKTIRELQSRQDLIPPPTESWQFNSLAIYDQGGSLLYYESAIADDVDIIDADDLFKMELENLQQHVIVNRKQNRFTALQRQTISGMPAFVALGASLDPGFISASDSLLNIYQRYRTLEISSFSYPEQLVYAYVSISLVILIIAVAGAVWISRRMTRPLSALVKGTEAVAAGNLDHRIEQRSSDEIGDLVNSFNKMTADLQTYQLETVRLEKMAAWREVARRLAHEIKNPLTPIQLTVQEMVDQYSGTDAEYKQLLSECHAIINEEVEALRKLVAEFSAFGRMPELEKVPTNINQTIEDITVLYAHRKIELELDRNIPEFSLDEDRMRRSVINLLENAMHADDSAQAIRIATKLNNGYAEIEVEDHGAGIPPEQVERIFEPYFTTKSKGIGLGLAITRQMVEEHGGTITVESQPGQGTTFYVRLPMNGNDG